jgi:hypothetical protein
MQFDHPSSTRNVSSPQHLKFHPHSHPLEQRGQNVLHMVRRRSEVLKHTTSDASSHWTFGKTGNGQEAECQHRGRTSRANVPGKRTAFDPFARNKGEFLTPNTDTFGMGVTQLSAGQHSSTVLGT